MYARVWRMSVVPESFERFTAACRSVGVMNTRKRGYRGLLILRGGPLDSPDATVVSLWDSLEALRASESDVFQKAVAKALACCLPGAALREEAIVLWESSARQNKKKQKHGTKKKGRVRRRAS
jgi:heme-degrading monooxygenase HmoA